MAIWQDMTAGLRRAIAIVLLALCALAVPAPAFADEPSQAEVLKSDYDAWSSDVSALLGDVADWRDDLLTRYQCPPNQPNKEAKYAELHSYTARLNRLRARGRTINDRRTALGRAGEGQVSSGIGDRVREGLFGEGAANNILITDANMTEVNGLINQMADAIRGYHRELGNIPPSERDCDPSNDPIRTITWNAPSQEPGTNVNATISATTASGKAVIISAVTVNGIANIGNPGAIGGLGGANVNYNFRIADIRREGPFNLNVTVSGLPAGFPAGTAPLSMTINVNYTVQNVAPTIESVPAAPSAEPGDALDLQGQVVVVDRNADNLNAGEVTARMVQLGGHPAGLETTPGQAFQRFSRVRLVSHDATAGRYVFDVRRVGTTRSPHAHGRFTTQVNVADRRGNGANEPIDLIVENVAPTLTLQIRPRRHFHAGDGQQVQIIGAVEDRNGAADIAEIEIDASQAGGAVYRLSQGSVIRNPGGGDDGFSFRMNPGTFGHTNNSGEWPITAKVEDGGAPEQNSPAPLVANRNTSITVTNLEPDIGPIGYISNLGLQPDRRNVCPREVIRVGIMVNDPEGDTLQVRAVIRETGESTDLEIEPMNTTYTGYVLAPANPGEYTIEFVVTERGVNNPHTVSKTIELTVAACGDEDEPRAAPEDGDGGEEIAVNANPGAGVKIGAEPPALPGELPDNFADILAYAELLQLAAILDDLDSLTGEPGIPGEPPLTLQVIGMFWQDFLFGRDYYLLEDGGNYADGTCGIGDGLGPVFEIGDPPETPPAADPALDAFDQLFADALEQSRALDEDLEYDIDEDNWDLGLRYSWNPELDIQLEYGDWIDQEFGNPPPAPDAAQIARERAAADAQARAEAAQRAAAEKAAEKARLQARHDELSTRAGRLNTAMSNTQALIDASDDATEIARLRTQLAELQTYSDSIHSQTTDVATRLNELDQERMTEEQELRTEISNRINRIAADTIADKLGIEESLQDAKESVVWGTRWISSGSRMQHETARTTRMADRELVSAEVKLLVIEAMRPYVQGGSTEEQLLDEFQARYERQKAAAEELLSSNRNISLAGYGIDIGTLILSAGMVQLGKAAVANVAGRTLAPAAAEQVVANTTERGLIELGKSALGRSGTNQAAASGTSNAAANAAGRTGSQMYDDAANAAANASRTDVDIVMNAAQRAAQNASRTEVINAGAQAAGRAAAQPTVSGPLRQMAAEATTEAEARAYREAAELVERTARELGVSEWTALYEHILENMVGRGVLRPNTPQARAIGELLDQAGQRGREAFNSAAGQRAAANAPAAAAQQAQGRAAEIMAERYGSEAGRGMLNNARQRARDWVDDIDFGSSSQWLPAVPILFGMMMQEGYAEEAPQATIDSQGQGRIPFSNDSPIRYLSPTIAGFQLSGGGSAYGTQSQNSLSDVKGANRPRVDFTVAGNQFSFSSGLSYDYGGSTGNEDFCRIKKLIDPSVEAEQ